MRKKKVKLAVLCASSYIVSVLPLLLTFLFNLDEYTKSVQATTKLTVGGLVALTLILFRTLGKTLPKGIGGTLLAFLLAYLLEAILADLVLLLGMCLLGEGIDNIFFQRYIKTLREDLMVEKAANATAEQIDTVLRRYIGGGRV